MQSIQGKGLVWLLIYLNNSPVFNSHQEIISEIIIIGSAIRIPVHLFTSVSIDKTWITIQYIQMLICDRYSEI